MALLKVSTKSSATSVAGAIAGFLKEEGKVELQAIGAGAVNQMVKAIAIARGFVACNGIDLVCVPGFVDLDIEGREKTAIKMLVFPKQ